MSEKCQLCKGAFSDDAVACPGGGWACKACVVKALILLKRIEAGESVEIRKVNGEWPFVGAAFGLVEFYNMKLNLALRNTFPEAAAAWNAQARDAEKERGGE